MSKRLVITLFLMLVLGYNSASASIFMSKESNVVSSLDSLDDDLYIFGNYGEVYGIVGGDLSTFCFNHEADGIIGGNANIFAYKVRQAGNVNQSARIFGYEIYIDAVIGRNLLVLGNDVEFGDDAEVGKDLNCTGDVVNIKGDIKGNANINGRVVYITGRIDGDVEIKADEIYIDSPARIEGELVYTSKYKAEIDEDVIIAGGVDWIETKGEKDSGDSGFHLPAFIRALLFLMTLLTGFALILILNRHTRESALQIEQRFWQTLAIGLLSHIIFIVGSIVLFIMIVGIPLAVILSFLGMVLFYIGKIYVSIAIGRILLRLLTSGKKVAIGWEFLVGLVILTIIFRIPVLGTIVYIVTFILGTGAAITGYMSLCRKLKDQDKPPEIIEPAV
ncbi:MAG: hypothetical protein AB1746_01530 [Candidatus Zixiibacteriota bacterium]